MSRVLRVGWLILSAVVLCSRPADAGLPDWLEQLSGPGPFESDGLAGFVSNVWCFERFNKITLSQDDKQKNPCLYVDFHKFINDDDDNFYKASGQDKKQLRATAYALGVAFQPWEKLHTDFGADFGRITFHTSETDAGHLTVGGRAQVKPLLFVKAFGADPKWRKWASVPKVYLRRSVILGTLNGAKDFGAIGKGSTYERKNEGLWSCGLLLDFSELLRPN